ncbi:MAG: VOC family protein [Acidobacteria bacterium]|nr:VOC family protein [Acidobacteriota bacterium]
MTQSIFPMIHVPDVRATVEWYVSVLGFTKTGENIECGEMNWARLRYGASEIMLNIEGRPSDAFRREVDLYLYASDVDALYERLHERVDIVEPPHDTHYGMREFILRDCNRFWITFGQPMAN